jgi:septum formation protein
MNSNQQHQLEPKAAEAINRPFIYLASQSPQRARLLDQLGVLHRPLWPESDEDSEALEVGQAGEAPRDYVLRVTGNKLRAARARLLRKKGLEAPILCADTTVALDGRIFGKPADADEAWCTLRALSGRVHQVLTAVALAHPTLQKTHEAMSVQISQVHVALLSDEQITRYIASGEPFGKAGSYGIQGRFAAFVHQIEGSHSAIMGLPLFETAQLLQQVGLSF